MTSIYDMLASIGPARSTDGVLIEVGAHHGQDSLSLREMYPSARIVIFEPDPRNAYQIRRAGIDKRVTLIEAAVRDRDGEAEFLLSSGRPPVPGAPKVWTQSSSLKRPREHLSRHPWCRFDGTAKVKTTTLDTFTSSHGIGRVEFLWADVQGAEAELIAGGQRTLAATRLFFTEYSDGEMYEGQISLQEIMSRLPGEKGAWEIVGRFAYDVLLRNSAAG